MKAEVFNRFLKEMQVKSFDLLGTKSHDYATEDVLSNAKRNSAIARLFKIDFSRDYHHMLFLTLMKWDRIQNLFSAGKTPKNESIDDTLVDALNYTLLTAACIKEMLDEEKAKSSVTN